MLFTTAIRVNKLRAVAIALVFRNFCIQATFAMLRVAFTSNPAKDFRVQISPPLAAMARSVEASPRVDHLIKAAGNKASIY